MRKYGTAPSTIPNGKYIWLRCAHVGVYAYAAITFQPRSYGKINIRAGADAGHDEIGLYPGSVAEDNRRNMLTVCPDSLDLFVEKENDTSFLQLLSNKIGCSGGCNAGHGARSCLDYRDRLTKINCGRGHLKPDDTRTYDGNVAAVRVGQGLTKGRGIAETSQIVDSL